MKKIIAVTMVILFLFAFTVTQGWARTKKSKAIAEVAENKKKSDLKRTKELLDQKRLELENTQGDIAVKLSSGEKKVDDGLVFKNTQFSSREVELRGFKAVSYSLALQDDGTVIFETMQSSEEGGTIFWKGEISPDNVSVRGMLSEVAVDQSSQDLYFSGSKVPQGVEVPQDTK